MTFGKKNSVHLPLEAKSPTSSKNSPEVPEVKLSAAIFKLIEELLARAIARLKDRVLVDLKIEVGPLVIRLPKSGKRCPYTGLNRTSMRQLVVACPENNFRPPVGRTIILRQPGATRGIVLVDYASLKAYLDKLATQQESEREESR